MLKGQSIIESWNWETNAMFFAIRSSWKIMYKARHIKEVALLKSGCDAIKFLRNFSNYSLFVRFCLYLASMAAITIILALHNPYIEKFMETAES